MKGFGAAKFEAPGDSFVEPPILSLADYIDIIATSVPHHSNGKHMRFGHSRP